MTINRGRGPQQKPSGTPLQGGFTLIELLVVVLIIGILAAIAVPQYRATMDRTHFARLLMLTRAVKDAQERYYMANGTYTTVFDQLDVQMPAPKSASAAGRVYENGDSFMLVAQGPSTPWAVYAANNKVLGGRNNTLLIAAYDKSNMAGGIYCYAYENDKSAHQLCKSLGGVVAYTGCDSSRACSAYRILK